MTDWLTDAARRRIDCRDGHDIEERTLTCRRCGEQGEYPVVRWGSAGEVLWYKPNLPDSLKTLPERQPWMESPEAYAGTWGRVPSAEEWAKLVKEWNTPDWQLDMS